jgi:hypothetical protein
MKNKSLITASVCAILLAMAAFIRIGTVKHDFDLNVREAHKITEGYDQSFIDMVKRLEVVLATRASFGYPGGKDPMTGVERRVVQPSPKAVSAAPSSAPRTAAQETEAADPVQLTAIISEAAGKKATAVVMDGERSLTVDVGDIVAGRKVTKISNESVWMENGRFVFYYDIHGKREKKPLDSSSRRQTSW